MRSLLASVLLGFCLVASSGCSLVYDGSRFQGGNGGGDGGTEIDTGTEVDSGGAGEDADVDAAPTGCVNDSDCVGPQYCAAGMCERCDDDGDGFAATEVPAGSCPALPHQDCNDRSPTVFPGADPICNNGVNEACFDTAMFPLDNVRELGFIPPIEIDVRPMGVDLLDVDVYTRSPTTAVVFTRIRESQRTPLAVEVDLAAGTHGGMRSFGEWAGIMAPFAPAAGMPIFTEYVRVGEQLYASEIHVGDGNTMHTSSWRLDGTGAPSRTGMTTFALSMLGIADGFAIISPPMLTRPFVDDELFWAVQSNDVRPGATAPAFYSVATEGTHLAPIDQRPITGRPFWAASSERFGLLTQEGSPSYFVWNGSINDPGDTSRITFWGIGGTGGVSAAGAIATVDPGGGRGGPYALVALPKGAMIELVLLDCGDGPAPTCVELAAGSIDVPGGAPSSGGIALAPVSDTSVMLILGDGAAAEGIRFGAIELLNAMDAWTLPTRASPPALLRLPSDGMGRLLGLALDPRFTMDGAGGSALVSYAYVREPLIGAMGSRLAVAAVHACVGYPGF